MAFSVPVTGPTVVLGTGATVVYQVQDVAGKFAVVKSLILCNTTALAQMVTLYRSPTAGTATDAFAFVKDLTIDPKTSIFFAEGELPILGRNESIRGLCSLAASVTAMASVTGEL